MLKDLKFAVVSAIFLAPLAYPHSALSWNWKALSYQESVWMCGTGNLEACDVMYAYEMARSGVAGGSPADLPQDRAMSASRFNEDFGAASTTPK